MTGKEEQLMRRSRRKHSAAFKAKMAVATIRGDSTLAELAELFDVHPNQITQWKLQLLERAAGVFETAGEKSAEGPNVKAPVGFSIRDVHRNRQHRRGLKATRDGYLTFNAPVHNGRFLLALRKTARAKKSAKKATGRRPKAAPKVASAVKKAPGRAAKAITKTARKAVKDAPKVVITVARKTHAGARRATVIGATLEKVGRVVEAGAAAVDTVASAMEKPAGTGRGRANATTKRRKRSA